MKVGMVLTLGLGLGLGACQVDPQVATPNQEVIAINAYNAAVVSGTAYLRLPLCGTAPCRTQAASQAVYTALRSGRAARKQLLDALGKDQAAPLTALQTLRAVYTVVESVHAY